MSSPKFTRPTSPFTAVVLAMKLAVLAETEEQFDRATTELLYWADEIAPEDVSLAKERCMQELELV